MTKRIRLGGFGDFSENPEGLDELKQAAKDHKVACVPGYYDWELIGDRDEIEKITMELWSMPRDEWGENLLTEMTA